MPPGCQPLAFAGQPRPTPTGSSPPEKPLNASGRRLRVRHELADRLGVAAVRTTSARAHWTLREFGDGLDCFQQALAIAREIGNRYSEVISLNNLGEARSPAAAPRPVRGHGAAAV